MPRDYLIIDADTHINEPPDLFKGRMPTKLADRAPRVDSKDGGLAWLFENESMNITQMCNAAGYSPLQWQMNWKEGFNGLRSGAWDPVERIKDMNIDMVDVHVLFPTYFLFGPTLFSKNDRELKLACIRAYNDWLSEFCSQAPDRLMGAALTPDTGVEDAIAEARRCRELPGLVGMLLVNYPNGSPHSPDHAADDRFWAVMEELDMPPLIHVGFDFAGEVEAEQQATISDKIAGLTLPKVVQERLAISLIPVLLNIILGGVLERHPLLRLGCIEVGAGWVPFVLEQTDDMFARHRFWTQCDLPMLPSEYWYRQCFTTFQIDTYALQNLERVGVGNAMWSSDYPHTGADWPSSRISIERTFVGVSKEQRPLLLGENALRLYGRQKTIRPIAVGADAGRIPAAAKS